MDWEGLKTAYLDRERARLGLPTREQEMMKRAAEARAAAESASQLETAGVTRDYTRARAAALPAEQALNEEYKRSMIERNLREPQPRAEPSSLEERILAMPPDKRAEALALYRQMHPPSASGAGGAAPLPKTGWSKTYGPDGKLIGYTHPAVGFKTAAELGMPPGSKAEALTGGERDALALGSVPIRAGDTMSKALEATQAAEAEHPWDPRTWTGPIAGRVGTGWRGMVDSSGPGGDFDQARAEGRALVYALSGKQINETEQAWLDRILPRLADRGVGQQIERFNRFVGYLRLAKAKGYADPFAVAQAQFDSELPSATPGAGEPAAPAAGVEKWVRDANGRLVRAQ